MVSHSALLKKQRDAPRCLNLQPEAPVTAPEHSGNLELSMPRLLACHIRLKRDPRLFEG